MVVALVGVELVGTMPGAAFLAADRRDLVKQLLEQHAVVGIGAGQDEDERDATVVHGSLRGRLG